MPGRKSTADEAGVKAKYPFIVDAIVLLPDHLHCLWTLPRDDNDYPKRWMLIKGNFTRTCHDPLAVEFQTGTKEQYVRVYTEGFNKPQGRWMMRAEDIAGLTPEQIQQKFALPQVPTHVVDAEVPSNFRLRMGEAGANKFAPHGGGGIQAQAIEDYGSIKFSNPRPLP